METDKCTDDEIIVSALDLIKGGIQKGDWSLVCRAFKYITGEEIAPPVKLSRIENIRAKYQKQKQQTKKQVVRPKSAKEIEIGVISQTVDGVQIIASEVDQEEIDRNKRLKPRHITPPKRNTELQSKQTASFNFNPTPELKK